MNPYRLKNNAIDAAQRLKAEGRYGEAGIIEALLYCGEILQIANAIGINSHNKNASTSEED